MGNIYCCESCLGMLDTLKAVCAIPHVMVLAFIAWKSESPVSSSQILQGCAKMSL